MSHLGRETFLTPVSWQNGWPVVGDHRKAVLECDGPLWTEQKANRCMRADFNKAHWKPEWIFLRNPREGSYVRGDGELLLIPAVVHFGDKRNPVFAAVRQGDFDFELNTEFIFDPHEEGDEAGIAIVLSSRFYHCFAKKKIGGDSFLVLDKNADDMYQRVCKIPLPEGKIYLRVRGEKEYYYFSYSINGEDYREVARASTRFLACEVSGKCFTGTVVGVYAASDRETEAVMRVDAFEMSTVLSG